MPESPPALPPTSTLPQVDGFPPADELRTVYVEHDIQASHADLNVVDFVFADELLHSGGLDVSREEIEAQLTSIGFTEEMLTMVITSLSGGWKMKLALARWVAGRGERKLRLVLCCGAGGCAGALLLAISSC